MPSCGEYKFQCCVLFIFRTGSFCFFQMKSLGQFLRGADMQFQFATEKCECGNKTERSLQSAPPIFSIGTVACSNVEFAMLIHFGYVIKESQSKKLYKINVFLAIFEYCNLRMNVAIVCLAQRYAKLLIN